MADIYKQSGVDYDQLDPAKHRALAAAEATSALMGRRGGHANEASRGEPAFTFELDGRTFGFVLECLGTESLFARMYEQETGKNRFADVAYDSVAAVVNDLICTGALPLVINAYFAVGDSSWYANTERANALVDGWQRACMDAGATWGGGESPSLSGLISAEDIDLAGAAVGVVPEGCEAITGDALAAGDEIVLIASSGLHANGLSLARKAVEQLPDGARTKLPSSRELGDAVLDPSILYVKLVEQLQLQHVGVTYLSHITGHGFRKIMRLAKPFTYRIAELQPVPEVCAFLAEHHKMSSEDAYGTFNMGSAFAVYCKSGSGARVVEIAKELGLFGLIAGHVEEGVRQVVIEPLGVTFTDTDYQAPAKAR